MLQSIWTQCGGKSNLAPLSLAAFRVNAANFNQALLKLVDSIDEYHVLEQLVDSVKLRPDQKETISEASHLHYVVRCSYRYPPLKHGSRFGSRNDPGIWYGSSDKVTALAETAYYQLRFVRSSEGLSKEVVSTFFAVFDVQIKTHDGVYLNLPPFDKITDLKHPSSYAVTQRLGKDMREDEVQAAVFASARWEGLNVAVFRPSAFVGDAAPQSSEVWIANTTIDKVMFLRRSAKESYQFTSKHFSADGVFPLIS